MAIARVQGVAGTETVQGAITPTLSSTGAGNLLVAVVCTKGSSVSQSITSVIDNKSQAWTAGPNVAQITNTGIWIYYFLNTVAGVTSVTITPDASLTVAAFIWEFSGVGSLDTAGSAAAWASTTAATTPGYTSANAVDLIIAGLEWPGSPTIGTLTGGFTQETTAQSHVTGAIANVSGGYQIVAATATYTYAGTLSATSVGAGAIMGFQATAAVVARSHRTIRVNQAVMRAVTF